MTTFKHEVQNFRDHMEDRHIVHLSEKYDIFAVYDGHGGFVVAEFLKNILHMRLLKIFEEHVEIEKNIEALYKEIDKLLNKIVFLCGSTAVVAIHDKPIQKLYFINLGDSRAILVHDDKCIHSTQDHKPTNKEEKIRIENNQGKIIDGRVNGYLSISRVFGDSILKKNMIVSNVPTITTYDLMENYEYTIVVASDGLWDKLSNDDVASIIKNTWNENIARYLINCATIKGSNDNITVIVHKFISVFPFLHMDDDISHDKIYESDEMKRMEFLKDKDDEFGKFSELKGFGEFDEFCDSTKNLL